MLSGKSALALLILAAATPLSAHTTMRRTHSVVRLHAPVFTDAPGLLASLRSDVDRHPTEFIRFETRAAAAQFLNDHPGADSETDPRLNERGVVGYWQGKTLVLLPSLSSLIAPF